MRPKYSERTTSTRAKIYDKEFIWCGDILMKNKSEKSHDELSKLIFEKPCMKMSKVVWINVTGYRADFDIGLVRHFRNNLNAKN